MKVSPRISGHPPTRRTEQSLLETMGRPPLAGIARTKQFSFSVTEEERKAIVETAEALGIPITHFMREAVLHMARMLDPNTLMDRLRQVKAEGKFGSPPWPVGTVLVQNCGYAFEKTAKGWKRQHRLRVEESLGRDLGENEVVHHIDENKTNNDLENLMVMEPGEHTRHHNALKRQAGNKRLEMGVSNLENTPVSNLETPEIGSEIVEEDQDLAPVSRTRADAPPSARTQNKTKNIQDPSDSSLRSQAAPVSAAQAESDPDEPWSDPAPLKLTFKLSSGEPVTNTWLFANGTKIPGPDVIRLLESPTYRPLKKAMLQCFARSLRDVYRRHWCAAYNRKMNAWRDTARSNSAFLRAAEVLAQQYADRNMTSSQFIEACNEMRPKSVRFVPVDMLGGAIGARVADWVPPEQRSADKLGESHMDSSGTQWITPHGEAEAIPVLRTAADRERFLKAIKVRA